MTPTDLRRARQALGLSRVRLGALAGVTERSIEKIEKGLAVAPAAQHAVERYLAEAAPPHPPRSEAENLPLPPAEPG